MSSIFTKIQRSFVKKSNFNLSHEHKLSMDMGQLVPFLCQEVLPGEKWRASAEVMIRFAPLLAPVMHRINVYTHYFFVPNRLVWDDWKDFITAGADGNAKPVFPTIHIDSDMTKNGTLLDYLGVPKTESTIRINALPIRAYNLIYNEFYRDQTLHTAVPVSTSSGIDSKTSTKLLNRCWEKDYFTSALPWSQRGGDVNIGSFDKIELDKSKLSTNLPKYVDAKGETLRDKDSLSIYDGNLIAGKAGSKSPTAYDPNGTLKVSGSVTVNDLRRSSAIQRWLENNATGGSRYVEQLLSHFGVRSSDASQQRPQYLGGGKSPVVVSEVLQTSESTETGALGTQGGQANSIQSNNGFKFTSEEHGFVIGIISVLPRTSYQQGLPKVFRKFDTFDYGFPEFANLGEQAIFESELYLEQGSTDKIFGYTPRYAEYKYVPSMISGDFKDSLNFWHLGRRFSGKPNLNSEFVEVDPKSLKRIFAVADYNHSLWVQIYNNINARRPLPRHANPIL